MFPAFRNPNYNADYRKRVKNVHTRELERVYDPDNNRRKVILGTIPFVLLNVLFISLTIAPFVQWCVHTAPPLPTSTN